MVVMNNAPSHTAVEKFLDCVAAHMVAEGIEPTEESMVAAMQDVLRRQQELCSDPAAIRAVARETYRMIQGAS